MADLSINSQISNSLRSSENTRGIEAQKTADAKNVGVQSRNPDENLQSTAKDSLSKAGDVKTSEYGPVIAKSGDGDTVRVKSNKLEAKSDEKDNSATIYDALKASNEKREKEAVPNIDLPEKKAEAKPEVKVEAKADEVPSEEQKRSKIDLRDDGEREKLAKRAAENAKRQTIEESDPGLYNMKNQDKITKAGSSAYAGYTDAQLQKMYLNGEVSQIEYNEELEARDAARQARMEATNENTHKVIEAEAESSENERTAEIVNTIQSGNVAEGEGTVPIDVRLQAIQNMDQMISTG